MLVILICEQSFINNQKAIFVPYMLKIKTHTDIGKKVYTPPPIYLSLSNKMHLSPPVASAAVRSKAVVLLLLTFCLLLLPLWESVIVLCFVVRYFMSILVLQSS